MSDFKQKMSGLMHGGNETAGLYTLLIGMAAGNLLPSPSDALYFRLQARLRDKWKRGELSATDYWKKNTFYYYSVPFLYWAFLAILVINVKGSAEQKLKIAGALVGGGVALGVVLKLIQNDKQQLLKEDEERDLLLKSHPEIIDILKRPEFENIAGQIVGNVGKDSGADGAGKQVKFHSENEALKNKLIK